MKKVIGISLIFVFLACMAFGQEGWVERKMSAVVVVISDGTSMGTGFFISPDGYIITAKHVIDMESEKATVYTRDMRSYGARVVGYHSEADIALLKVELPFGKEPEYFTTSDISNYNQTFVGDEVYLIGHPLGIIWTVTKGIVSAKRRDDKGVRYIQVDTSASFGSSGGVVFDEHGKLLGVMVFGAFIYGDFNFAIYVLSFAEEIRALIEEDILRIESIKNINIYKKEKYKVYTGPYYRGYGY